MRTALGDSAGNEYARMGFEAAIREGLLIPDKAGAPPAHAKYRLAGTGPQARSA